MSDVILPLAVGFTVAATVALWPQVLDVCRAYAAHLHATVLDVLGVPVGKTRYAWCPEHGPVPDVAAHITEYHPNARGLICTLCDAGLPVDDGGEHYRLSHGPLPVDVVDRSTQ